MDALLSRFRNLMVLAIVIALQLLLLAYQVKSGQDMRLIRVWAVSAITPAARIIEAIRSGTTGFFSDYFLLLDVRDENRKLKSEIGRIKLENQFLKTELSTADRARALTAFQTRSPSKTVAARIIGNGTGANSKVVFIDRGSVSGVEKGMAVITPDGIVGKIIQAFPMASQVLLVTDSSFAAGVISVKNHVRGTLEGQGGPNCKVDYVQNEEKVDNDEWFYTSGDDRVFPKGLPVGQAVVVRQGKTNKEIFVTPSGLQNGFEEVLVVIEGVHQPIPDPAQANPNLHMLPPPPPDATAGPAVNPDAPLLTDADRMLEHYKKIGEAEGHQYGASDYKIPDFNIDPDKVKRPAPANGPSATGGATPAGDAQPPAANGASPARPTPVTPNPAAKGAPPGTAAAPVSKPAQPPQQP
jgi:rod shape-determining protein MreC